MKTSPLKEIFDIEYGNQLDFNKMSPDENGVNFVSRSSQNLGVSERVKKIEDVAPYESGLITVTLGGSYLLSAFVQPEPFYTAQNIKVLRPKHDLSFKDLVYYCTCITANRFKYSSHGREANRSLNGLQVPAVESIPSWVDELESSVVLGSNDHDACIVPPYEEYALELVRLDQLFDVRNGIASSSVTRSSTKESPDHLPYIRPSKDQMTSYVEYVDKNSVDKKYVHPRGTVYISTDGQGSHTYSYVSTTEMIPNSNVATLVPISEMTLQEKLFYAMAISMNRKWYSYGRKPKGERLKSMRLPKYPPPFVYKKNYIKELTESY